MSLTVCQIDDPYAIRVISSCEVSLEEDGSLDTTRIGFVNEGDSFVGYPDPRDGKAYNPLIHRSLPSTISPTKLRKSLRLINGAPALPLIRLTDYDKALSRQVAQQKEVAEPSVSSIILPHEVKRPVEGGENAPSRTHLLPRRLANPDKPHARDEPLDIAIAVRQQRVFDPNVPAIRNWELNLEYNFSLDTSKLTSLERGITYYSPISSGQYVASIQKDELGSSIDAGSLEYHLRELPGVSLPVLFLMSEHDLLRQQRKGLSRS